ncbi:hypothetical protein NBRC116594_28510 [Shimia sp. NS0008-38b]|uniref:endonuclease/exonuclease/phosphatase family protein n=1 Tax=Shimia sp. NS0008-38b TaxID=3127653 RepID=UPI003103753B
MSLNYTGMRYIRDSAMRERCAERLLLMRERLAPLRNRKSDSKLLLATWNIRDFDGNKFKWGPRLPETFYYLAEMMSCFDLIAVQEVNRDLKPLQKLVRILGREWDYIVTDVTEGWSGNAERLAFVYNTEKVWFRKMAGEVVLPKGQLIVTKKLAETEDGQKIMEEVDNQFARTPYTVAFQSGWFKFNLCTVHIYYGSASGAKLQRRIDEIARLMKFFRRRQDKENRYVRHRPEKAENYILLGDFNVVSPEHETMEALESNGFHVPDEIGGNVVRLDHGKYYDQIALRVEDERFKVLGGGVVNMFEDVFRDTEEDRSLWEPLIPEDMEPDEPLKKRYDKWRTFQMSDHSPLWIEIDTEYTRHYLDKFASPDA